MPVPQYITSQEQARCLFHNTSLLKNRQDACSTIHHFSRTGKMPVPQYIKLLVGLAGRPSNFY
ncbi:hypothetical protein [Microcoleus sp. M2_C4]|uniref:hypothetical protein n=1 Tax=unclassified Microcoleus TaxID=2642155 RepID=UPI002FD28FA3